MRANLPDKAHFLGKRIPTRPDIELVEFIKSGNNAHVFKAYSHEVRRNFACKIIPKSNLTGASEGKDTWRQEIDKANAFRVSSVVRFVDKLEWIEEAADIDCVVLVADFILGHNLSDFIGKHQPEVTIPFIVQFLETMFDFLNEMETLQLPSHGDLHAGNILVEDRRSALRGDKFEFRITDFGVAAATSETTKFKDDYFQLAVILKQLLESFEQRSYQSAEPKDQFIFNALNNDFLGRHLVERDKTLDPLARRPGELFKRLQQLDDEYEQFAVSSDTRIGSPFDFLSCEQIGDVPSILKALYSDLFLGLDDIESRNNLVVTGPRGCGKSTVFRNLSLRQKLRTNAADPESITYLGVFYFCNDLYFSFPRYQLPKREDAWDIPIQFLTATLLGELLEDVSRWGESFFADEFHRGQQRASRRLFEVLEIEPPKEPGSDSFKAIETELHKIRRRAVFDQRNAHKSDHSFGRHWGADKLQLACEVLRASYSFLRDRPIYFFIDDYSAPKVTKDLQSNLNRVLMQRSSSCFFKLSTESPVSFSARDIDQKEYVESREYSLLNLGLIYLADESERKLRFIEDVFRRRFEAADTFKVKDLETLVGSNPDQNANEDAREIRRVKRLRHWSKQTLSNLCSGDIFYLIRLVREMVTTPKGSEGLDGDSVPRIPIDVQDSCIRAEAGRFLKNLGGSCDDGDKLVGIVQAFGKVANSYLKYRDSGNEVGNPPWQASRVEPYERLNLGAEAKRLYDELLRYSVFIQDFRGKSRRGDVVPRLFLRRFLIPHFNLTFSTRDSVPLEPAEFELMILDPSAFEKRFRRKSPEEQKEGELPLG
jgi:serine/threonine protein kinase